MSGFLDTLAAPTVTILFAFFDALPVVMESLATATRVGQRRRRSFRAQGVLKDACTASHLRLPQPHAILTRTSTTAYSSMTSLSLAHRTAHGVRIIASAAAAAHSPKCSPERLLAPVLATSH